MKKLELIKPTIELQNEYLNMLEEWKETNEPLVPWVLKLDATDFEAMIRILEDNADKEQVPNGFVPNSTYWLVGESKKILGVTNIRHALNDKLRFKGGHIGYGIIPKERMKGYATEILRLALEKIKTIGVKQVLVTCDKDNIGSAKVIIKNGGLLDSEDSDEGTAFQRYWIEI